MITNINDSKKEDGWDTEKGSRFSAKVRGLSQKSAIDILLRYETLPKGKKSAIRKLPHASVLNLLMRALIDGAIPASAVLASHSEEV